MLAGLGKGLLLRLGAYALFVWGFWLLFQAFERSNIAIGVGGGVAVLVAMWAMVGFRRSPVLKPKSPEDDGKTESEDNSTP
jgi:hypothetical protein